MVLGSLYIPWSEYSQKAGMLAELEILLPYGGTRDVCNLGKKDVRNAKIVVKHLKPFGGRKIWRKRNFFQGGFRKAELETKSRI